VPELQQLGEAKSPQLFEQSRRHKRLFVITDWSFRDHDTKKHTVVVSTVQYKKYVRTSLL
jgi:hypothetical protein